MLKKTRQKMHSTEFSCEIAIAHGSYTVSYQSFELSKRDKIILYKCEQKNLRDPAVQSYNTH